MFSNFDKIFRILNDKPEQNNNAMLLAHQMKIKTSSAKIFSSSYFGYEAHLIGI